MARQAAALVFVGLQVGAGSVRVGLDWVGSEPNLPL